MDLEFEELGLDLNSVTSRGRSVKAVDAQYSRDLTPEDLRAPKAQTQTAKPLAKIRDAHHALARVLATGTSEGEASLITGYSPSRISILKADPQFQELLAFYRSTTVEGVTDFRQRMLNLGMGALQELEDRLDDNPDSFSPALLKDIVKDMADRTGHAPNKGPSVEVHLNSPLADRIKAARARVESLNSGKVIDHE